MTDYEIISIITMFLALLATVYTFLIKSLTKKNSTRSEKILFEMKQVNDDVNDKIKEAIANGPVVYKSEGAIRCLSDVSTTNIFHKERDNKLDELIDNHHTQALSQSKIQFWFSLIAAVVGFVFIIIMVCLASSNTWYEYIVRVLPGAIIEAVSVLFFSQSRETRERASDFLNRLREDRQYEKGIAIAESISDEQLKSTLKAEIALRLCGIKDVNMFEIDKKP